MGGRRTAKKRAVVFLPRRVFSLSMSPPPHVCRLWFHSRTQLHLPDKHCLLGPGGELSLKLQPGTTTIEGFGGGGDNFGAARECLFVGGRGLMKQSWGFHGCARHHGRDQKCSPDASIDWGDVEQERQGRHDRRQWQWLAAAFELGG